MKHYIWYKNIWKIIVIKLPLILVREGEGEGYWFIIEFIVLFVYNSNVNFESVDEVLLIFDEVWILDWNVDKNSVYNIGDGVVSLVSLLDSNEVLFWIDKSDETSLYGDLFEVYKLFDYYYLIKSLLFYHQIEFLPSYLYFLGKEFLDLLIHQYFLYIYFHYFYYYSFLFFFFFLFDFFLEDIGQSDIYFWTLCSLCFRLLFSKCL